MGEEGFLVFLAQAEAGGDGEVFAAAFFAADAGGPLGGVVEFALVVARAGAVAEAAVAAGAGDGLFEGGAGEEAAHGMSVSTYFCGEGLLGGSKSSTNPLTGAFGVARFTRTSTSIEFFIYNPVLTIDMWLSLWQTARVRARARARLPGANPEIEDARRQFH